MSALRQTAATTAQTATPTRVIAVSSGKGGVGKTTVSINLAVALAEQGKRVVLMDADLGLANIDVLLGLKVERNLADVVNGHCSLDDVLLEGPGGVGIIPAASGVQAMAELSDRQRAGLIYAFSALAARADVLLIDSAAGISGSTVQFCAAAQEIVIVVCNEPASIADAYATIKVLHRHAGRDRFRVLVNMAGAPAEGAALFANLVSVTDRFLNVTLELVGTIPHDARVADAGRRRKPLIQHFPSSPAALALKDLATMTDKWPRPQAASGALEFFVERLVQPAVTGRHAQA